MSTPNPLDALKNIVEPTYASWWPLPPIYYLLFLGFIAFVFLMIFLFKKKQKAIKKEKVLFNMLTELSNNKGSFAELNHLLKRVALNYFERDIVASLHGKSWLDFLQTYHSAPLSGAFENENVFIKHLYEETQACSKDDLLQAKNWIKELPEQIKKQQQQDSKKEVKDV
jgi:hypothetical protein